MTFDPLMVRAQPTGEVTSYGPNHNHTFVNATRDVQEYLLRDIWDRLVSHDYRFVCFRGVGQFTSGITFALLYFLEPADPPCWTYEFPVEWMPDPFLWGTKDSKVLVCEILRRLKIRVDGMEKPC